jgi:hypothetical protein
MGLKLKRHYNDIDILGFEQEINNRKKKERIKKKLQSWGRNKYQKAVKLKKLVVVAIEAIDPAAKMHCEILRTSPVKVPGVPGKSFIFHSNTRHIQILNGSEKRSIFPTH